MAWTSCRICSWINEGVSVLWLFSCCVRWNLRFTTCRSSNEKVPMCFARRMPSIWRHGSPVTSRCFQLSKSFLRMWVNVGGLGTAACCQQRTSPLTHGHSIASGARSHPYSGSSTETCQGSMSNSAPFYMMLISNLRNISSAEVAAASSKRKLPWRSNTTKMPKKILKTSVHELGPSHFHGAAGTRHSGHLRRGTTLAPRCFQAEPAVLAKSFHIKVCKYRKFFIIV